MKIFTKSIPACLLVLTAALLVQRVSGQSILNPADSVYTYNANAAAGTVTNPNQPANGTIGKWIRTVRMSYSTNEWKCYIFEGMCFRLHFPLGYNPTANDGNLYPLLIFYHGAGEAGPITDNEESMAHGGQTPFQTASDAGTWPGYIIIPQNTNGAWDPTAITRLVGIIHDHEQQAGPLPRYDQRAFRRWRRFLGTALQLSPVYPGFFAHVIG